MPETISLPRPQVALLRSLKRRDRRSTAYTQNEARALIRRGLVERAGTKPWVTLRLTPAGARVLESL